MLYHVVEVVIARNSLRDVCVEVDEVFTANDSFIANCVKSAEGKKLLFCGFAGEDVLTLAYVKDIKEVFNQHVAVVVMVKTGKSALYDIKSSAREWLTDSF